ncbi:M48 family metalloprotease [Asticcacaulis taihuensis]|uniref:Putative Zn-dependent protease, contains TPR repeats n=1 Tax=Asticcacaulis taihuensis TaxID=260084 RepID=A0A1G4PGF7_9CAUL|nr:M48 family metalloprotease [Asticcacaulis taihuensis]SCW31326.1 Putative Zn-dependent protease, contains TPR repeats [Asticcacaulis taihuensis]
MPAFQTLKRYAAGMVIPACLMTAAVFLPVSANAQDSQSIIRDTEVEAFLKTNTRPVLDAAGLDPDRVHYLLIASDELNAFATTGLRIGINTGTIMEADNPNQLFGVIAHETGHLSGGHMMRTDEIERAARAPMAISLGLGIVAALAGAPDAGLGIAASSSTFGTLGALHYMQTEESAADVAGVKAMEKAGMSAKGLVDFFYKFRNVETFSNAERYQFFITHPLSRERIQATTRLAQSQPHYNTPDNPETVKEFDIVKAKLSGFLDDPLKTYQKYPETDTSYPARYARVIATYKRGQWDQAISQLDKLIAEQPENPYLWELKGQIYFETGRAALAVPAHLKSVELMPQAPLLQLNLGQALIAVGDKDSLNAAVAHLQQSIKYEEDDSFAWQQLAQAYDALNQPGLARLSTAEAQFYAGDYMAARTSAVWSQKYLDIKSPEYRRARDIVMTSSSEMGIDPVDRETQRRRKN